MPIRLDFAEHLAIVRFMAKWTLLLTPVAIAIGSVIAFFLWSLDEVTQLRFDHGWLLYLLPVAGVIIGTLYHRFGREVEAGNNLLIDEIHEPGGGIPARLTPLIFFASDLTHLAGGSAGREGAAVQMGGALAAAANRFFRLGPADVRILLTAGVAAGFGAVFGTPLAGAVFALEVLTIGRMDYTALVPALYASLAADYVTQWWGIEHAAYAIALAPRDIHGLPFDLMTLGKAVLAGGAFGLAALLFTELAHGAGRFFRHFIKQPILRPVVGGCIVIAMVYVLGTRDYLGLGVSAPHPGATTVGSAFTAGGADPFSWWWKILFTVVTLGSGFKGGEVTPLFFIGATLGNRVALILRAPVDLFAGLGFVAVFAGAANTPLACTIMGMELFGAGPAVYLAVACFVAYLVSGPRGIYSSQRLARGDGASGLRTLRETARPLVRRR